jgi:glycosyltransferase involved in cell wall biosynthesis
MLNKSIIVSCSGKFHAFALAEQLNKYNVLNKFFTSYAYQKFSYLRQFSPRFDGENIDPKRISCNLKFLINSRLSNNQFKLNNSFDKEVANKIKKLDYDLFIGWSGMSINSINVSRQRGIKTILERGSTHIEFQNEILQKEYSLFDKKFSIDQKVIDQELQEYELCDYISIPSKFVYKTFIDKGFSPEKLILNNYGTNFKIESNEFKNGMDNKENIILYLGTISVQKGVIYFLEASKKLLKSNPSLKFFLIGQVDKELEYLKDEYNSNSYFWFGKIEQHKLPAIISKCIVGVQPSLQEGLSMVIPQILACGVPVVASQNSGGEDLIVNGQNGFVIPIRDPQSIEKSILYFIEEKDKLQISQNCINTIKNGFTWNDYGQRYIQNITSINK